MTPSSKSSLEISGRLEMVAAMALSGTIGFFVVESGQGIWNVVFFRCLFGALGLLAYSWAKGLLSPWPFSRRTFALALRSEEHTSELQSRQYLVCSLLLETKT